MSALRALALRAFALPAFAAVAALHLAALLLGQESLAHVTKPALMPLLAAYVALRGGPRLLVAGLLCGAAGDVLLQIGGPAFLVGMGAFAAGHCCYLALFRARGHRPHRAVLFGYAAVWAVTLAALWPGLDPAMRGPVAAYSLLLAAMACAASAAGTRAGAGGALFLLSDTLIATRLADWSQPPAAGFWVMLTYLAAQYLLATGMPEAVRPQRTASSASTMPLP
ncbi:lysoplasmalogenase [Streptomyces boninensis]|uniref:lysoplasmalogenase n=1 Tax=Streptomyces boninensis TaxID=2039455 RepID=UPI003B21E4EA